MKDYKTIEEIEEAEDYLIPFKCTVCGNDHVMPQFRFVNSGKHICFPCSLKLSKV